MYCGSCGKPNNEGTRFCVHCGANLGSQTPARPGDTLDNAATQQGPLRTASAKDTLDSAKTIDGAQVYEGRLLAGRYKVQRQLGSGGMGEVWQALDSELDDLPVAIKVLPAVLARNAHSIKALKREAAVALRLAHPNVCRLHTFHSDEDVKFLVMEYIDGQTLEALLDEHPDRRMTLVELLPIATQIAAALDYAHGLAPAVLHRDIKPSNIMVTRAGVAKLLDFGIAREMKDSVTRVTGKETSGTLLYMSPEQFQGHAPTPASDIYSLAATLYECLAGHPPFYQGSIGHQLLHLPAPSIAGLSSAENGALGDALAKAADDRPRTAGRFAANLLAAHKGLAAPERNERAPSHPAPVDPQRTSIRGVPWTARLLIGALVAVTAIVLGWSILDFVQHGAEPPPSALEDPAVVAEREKKQRFDEQLATARNCTSWADREKGLQAVAEALRLYPSDAAAAREEQRLKALEDPAIAAERERKQRFDEQLATARNCTSWADRERGLQAVAEALRLYPSDPTALREEQRLKALEDPAVVAEREKKQRFDEQLATARSCTSWADREKGLQAVAEALRLYPGDAAAAREEQRLKELEDPAIAAEREKKQRFDEQLATARSCTSWADREKGLRAVVEALRLYPGDAAAAREEQRLKALEDPTVVAEREKKQRFDEQLATARNCTSWADRERGLQAVAEALRLYPSDATALRERDRLNGIQEPRKAPGIYTAWPFDAVEAKRRQDETARGLGASVTRTLDVGGGVKLELVLIPAGTFMMGSPTGETGRDDDETPHQVTISRPFYMSKTEVTQAQWQSVMGSNPSNFNGDGQLPVEQVSWNDCQEFCRKLSARTGQAVRLPSEAEWEHACRAGTATPFHFGATISTSQANYNGNYTYGSGRKGEYRKKTTVVGSFPANAWGLHDMHGNVWEWCGDWYGAYPAGGGTDPAGPGSGELRVLRGGSWGGLPSACRAADRAWCPPVPRGLPGGVRVVVSGASAGTP